MPKRRKLSPLEEGILPVEPVPLHDVGGHVVHRFVHGARTCACGQVQVPPPIQRGIAGRVKAEPKFVP